MPVITVKFKDKTIKEHSIIIGQDCSIGRKGANDIIIDNLSVSGFHAQIDSVSTTFVLRDLDSTNGTFVNNRKVSMHNLKHNDTILIGKHELVFDCSDIFKMKANEANPLDDEKTRVLDTDDFRKLTGQKAKERNWNTAADVQTVDVTQEKKPSFFSRLFEKIFG